MFRRAAAATLFLVATLSPAAPAPLPTTDAPTVEYRNGYWYEDGEFTPRSVYVRGGVFVDPPGEEPRTVVDLHRAYVVPGFAEAHHHTVLCDATRIDAFLDAGIVYAAIMNSTVSSRTCQTEFHGPDSLEVINALAGLTARNAHPSQIGRRFLDESEIDGEWVYYVDSLEDLDAEWRRLLANRPDFVKVFLSYSEDFRALHDDPSLPAWYRGIDPALVAPIVGRAHAAGLRVAAHVMSAPDFQVAVEAGVDVVAHMPGFAPGDAFTPGDPHPWLSGLKPGDTRYFLRREDAELAASRHTAVITTISGAEEPNAAVTANVRILSDAGVTLLIGSDRGEFHSVDEAEFLVEHGLMTRAATLHSLAVTTPRWLFPGRRIGVLEPGFEATFVGLRADPLADFAAIRDVAWVVKRGHVLRSPAAAPDAGL